MECTVEEVTERQRVFSKTFVHCFMKKLYKYQEILRRGGVNITNCLRELPIRTSCSFDEDIELVLKENSSALSKSKSFWKIGTTFSVGKIFSWVYNLVKRTKAARILSHIDYIHLKDIETLVTTVAVEISGAYEYQLCMLHGNSEVARLAQHGVVCVMTYLNSADAHFSQAGIASALLEGKPSGGNSKDILKTRDLDFEGHSLCYRWKMQNVFKYPGLRVRVKRTDGGEPLYHSLLNQGQGRCQKQCGVRCSCQQDESTQQPDNIEPVPVTSETSIPTADTNDGELLESSTDNSNSPSLDTETPDNECHKSPKTPFSPLAGRSLLEQTSSDTEEQSKTETQSSFSVTMETDDMDSSEIYKANYSIRGYDNYGHLCNTDDEFEAQEILGQIHDETDVPSENEHLNTSSDFKETGKVNSTPCDEINNVRRSFVQLELCDVKINSTDVAYAFYGLFTPFGAKCNPFLYGFRGPIHVSDSAGNIALLYNDSVSLRCPRSRQIPFNPDDLHQLYRPKTRCLHPVI